VTKDIEEPSAGLAPPAGRRGTPGTGGTPRRRRRGANKQLANGLVALSSAAIVAVYAAGYARTAPAAASLASGDAAALAVGATATTPSDAASPTAPATAATATTPSQVAAGRSGVAAAPTATTPAPTQTSQATQAAQSGATLRDGTYVGTGSSRHGSIQATVVVQGGRVVSAIITGCGTRYPCSDIAMLPGQVIARQSAGVDFVSGATDSSIAYRAAVAAALAKAR